MDGSTGQLNTGTLLNILAAIHLHFKHQDWGVGRPMGSGVGIKGSSEIVGRMTGKTAHGTMEKLNTGTLLNIPAAIHLQFQHSKEHKIILKHSEGGGSTAPHTPDILFSVGRLWRPMIQLYHIRQRIATIPGAWLVRPGCLGCDLSHEQY